MRHFFYILAGLAFLSGCALDRMQNEARVRIVMPEEITDRAAIDARLGLNITYSTPTSLLSESFGTLHCYFVTMKSDTTVDELVTSDLRGVSPTCENIPKGALSSLIASGDLSTTGVEMKTPPGVETTFTFWGAWIPGSADLTCSVTTLKEAFEKGRVYLFNYGSSTIVTARNKEVVISARNKELSDELYTCYDNTDPSATTSTAKTTTTTTTTTTTSTSSTTVSLGISTYANGGTAYITLTGYPDASLGITRDDKVLIIKNADQSNAGEQSVNGYTNLTFSLSPGEYTAKLTRLTGDYKTIVSTPLRVSAITGGTGQGFSVSSNDDDLTVSFSGYNAADAWISGDWVGLYNASGTRVAEHTGLSSTTTSVVFNNLSSPGIYTAKLHRGSVYDNAVVALDSIYVSRVTMTASASNTEATVSVTLSSNYSTIRESTDLFQFYGAGSQTISGTSLSQTLKLTDMVVGSGSKTLKLFKNDGSTLIATVDVTIPFIINLSADNSGTITVNLPNYTTNTGDAVVGDKIILSGSAQGSALADREGVNSTTGVAVTSFTFTGLTSGTTYYIRLQRSDNYSGTVIKENSATVP